MSKLPKKVKLTTKISIFPKGYEMEKSGGMYKVKGAISGLSTGRIQRALKQGEAKAINNE